MTSRHHKNLTHPLPTKAAALYCYIIAKGTQSRKIVQCSVVNTMANNCRLLFHLAIQMLDGYDTRKRMQSLLFDIQSDAYLVSIAECQEIRKRLAQNIGSSEKPKKRKHYGFDLHAVAYIDTTCDELHKLVCQYGQQASGTCKKSEPEPENDKGLPTCRRGKLHPKEADEAQLGDQLLDREPQQW